MGRRGRTRRRTDLVKAARTIASRGYELDRTGARETSASTVSLVEAVNAMTRGATDPQGVAVQQSAVRDMPRDPLDVSPFGPLWPLHVQAISPARPDTGQPEPRVWEYPQGFNLPGGGARLIDWEVLRAAARNVDAIRRCIQIRKEDLAQLDGSWVVSERAVKAAQEASPDKPREDIEAELRRQFGSDIERLTEFWETPWITNGVRLRQWFHAILEDHITFDGVAIYPVTSVGGDVIAFRLIDPATIKLLINDAGERPQPPYPAFQQLIAGFPRGEYWADVALDEAGQEILDGGLTAAQLTYWRENVVTYTPYGRSAVEDALISAALYLKRQGWMHAEYDEGSTPLTWLIPQGDKFVANQLSPSQRREYERAINDDMEGQTGKRHRIKVSYPGYQPEQMQAVEERYKPEYDIHLVRMLIGHFGVTMDRFGLTEAKGLGASGQHEKQSEVQDDAGLNPDARMLRDLVLELSRNYLDAPRALDFQFTKRKPEDEAARDLVLTAQRARGVLTLNEDRRALGRTTFNFPEADMPGIVSPTGIVYIEGGAQAQQAQQEQQAMMAEAAVAAKANPAAGAPGAPGGLGGPKPGPGGGSARGGAEPKPTPTGGGAKPIAKAAPGAISGELKAFNRWYKSLGGRPPVRPFRFEATPPESVALAYEHDYVRAPLDGRFMAFEGYGWVAEITKDWRAWNAAHPLHPRGPNGRFVRAGELLTELQRVHGPLDDLHENAFDEAVRRTQAGRPVRVGESKLTDELTARGLLEEMPDRPGKLQISEAGRQHERARWAPDDAAAPAAAPEPMDAEDLARARQAEIDGLRRIADLAAEVDEFRDAQFGLEESRRRVLSMSHRNPNDAVLAELAQRVAAADSLEEMDRIALAAARSAGLEPIGRAGDFTRFDPKQHRPIGERIEPGAPVALIRPGYAWEGDPDGKRPQLHRATAEEVTAEELRAYEAAQRAPEPVAVPEPDAGGDRRAMIESAIGQSAARRLEQAEIMYGSDRDQWPAAARRDAAKLERKLAMAGTPLPPGAPLESRGQPNGIPSTVGAMNTVEAQQGAPEPSVSTSLFPESEGGTGALARWTPEQRAAMEAADPELEAKEVLPERRRLSREEIADRAYGRGVTQSLFPDSEGVQGLRTESGASGENATVSALRGASSREQAHQLISGLTVAELRRVAADANVVVGSKRTKQQIRNDLVEALAGRRIDADVIAGARRSQADRDRELIDDNTRARALSAAVGAPVPGRTTEELAAEQRLAEARGRRADLEAMSLDELTQHEIANSHEQILGVDTPAGRAQAREYAARVEREAQERFGNDPMQWPFEARRAVARERNIVNRADITERLEREELAAEQRLAEADERTRMEARMAELEARNRGRLSQWPTAQRSEYLSIERMLRLRREAEERAAQSTPAPREQGSTLAPGWSNAAKRRAASRPARIAAAQQRRERREADAVPDRPGPGEAAPSEPRRFTADQLRELPWGGATREQIIEHGRKYGLSEADIDAELSAFGATRERQPGEAATLGPIGLARQREREDREAYLRAQTSKIMEAALGDGPTAVVHKPSREIWASMREQGWQIIDVDTRTRVMTLESPDGERHISMQVSGKAPTWWQGQNRLTLKRAAEIVAGQQSETNAVPDRPGPGEEALASQRAKEAARTAVRDSVARRANEQGWANIADIRDDLDTAGITDPAEQDQVLRDMLRQPGVRIVPIADQKTLTDRDRRRELLIGGEGNHAIRVDPEPGTVVDSNDIGRSVAPASRPAAYPATPDGVRAALGDMPSGYQRITDLRARLGGTRKEQDAAITELVRAKRVHLAPNDYPFTLTAEDRASALSFGQRENHLVMLDPGAGTSGGDGGLTDWQRDMIAYNEEYVRSGDAERKRIDVQIDTESRRLTAARRELARVEEKLKSEPAGSDRYEQLADARDALQEEVNDLDARIQPLREQREALDLGLAEPKKAKRRNKAAGEPQEPDPKAEPTPGEEFPAWAVDTIIAAGIAGTLSAALLAAMPPAVLAKAFAVWSRYATGQPATLPSVEQTTAWLAGRERERPQVGPAIGRAFADAYTEGWLAGAESARSLIQREPPQWSWRAGDRMSARRQARKTGANRQAELLWSEAGGLMRDALRGRLEAVAQALVDGREDLAAVIGDERKARQIAQTEVSRAVSAATLYEYRLARVPGKQWLNARDQRVCKAVCKLNGEAGPIGLADEFPSGDTYPPGHPECRCGLIPAYGDRQQE